jgi:hypothetical protein
MVLTREEFERFRALQSALNNFIYAKLQEAKGLQVHTAFADLPLTKQLEVRQAFATDHSLIDQFIAANPRGQSDDDLDTVGKWRQMVADKFVIVRHLKKHSIFLKDTPEPRAYGVVGLTQPIADVVGPDVPVIVETILLPFMGQIVYDGLIERFPISVGPGLRRSFEESYRNAKEQGQLITSLEPESTKVSPPKSQSRRSATKTQSKSAP